MQYCPLVARKERIFFFFKIGANVISFHWFIGEKIHLDDKMEKFIEIGLISFKSKREMSHKFCIQSVQNTTFI